MSKIFTLTDLDPSVFCLNPDYGPNVVLDIATELFEKCDHDPAFQACAALQYVPQELTDAFQTMSDEQFSDIVYAHRKGPSSARAVSPKVLVDFHDKLIDDFMRVSGVEYFEMACLYHERGQPFSGGGVSAVHVDFEQVNPTGYRAIRDRVAKSTKHSDKNDILYRKFKDYDGDPVDRERSPKVAITTIIGDPTYFVPNPEGLTFEQKSYKDGRSSEMVGEARTSLPFYLYNEYGAVPFPRQSLIFKKASSSTVISDADGWEAVERDRCWHFGAPCPTDQRRFTYTLGGG